MPWRGSGGRIAGDLPRRRLHSSRAAKARWSDAMLALGVVFLLVAVAVFVLLALAPTGYASSATGNPWILGLAGFLGLVLVGLGVYERRRIGAGRG